MIKSLVTVLLVAGIAGSGLSLGAQEAKPLHVRQTQAHPAPKQIGRAHV